MKDTFELTLNNPLKDEEWDILTDVDFDKTERIAFDTKHGKHVEFAKVIRCKDCKHRFEGEKYPNCCEVLMEMSQWLVEIPVKDEWHCGSGERKE